MGTAFRLRLFIAGALIMHISIDMKRIDKLAQTFVPPFLDCLSVYLSVYLFVLSHLAKITLSCAA